MGVWARHVARMYEMIRTFRSENLKILDHFQDADTDGRIILKLILRKEHGRVWTEFM
jgi:hypothetical protein